MTHHAERAGDVDALIEFARCAAEDAVRVGAHSEAAAHYATMLDHRAALDADMIVTTLEQRAEQSYLVGVSGEAMESMREAAALRREAGDTIRLGHDLTRLTRYAWVSGRRKEAERFIAEAIEVLHTAPAGPELAWAYSHRAQLDMLAFEDNDAILWGERALRLAERLGEHEIVVHALANIGTSRARLGEAGDELRRSYELACAGNYHDHVERSLCNLACAAYWARDDRASLAYIEQGTLYALTRDLTHWEVYLRGWSAMIRIDQGQWGAAESEAEEMVAWTRSADLFRFPALLALARLRVRRGDADVDSPLQTARTVATNHDELQRLVYVAVIDAERAWLGGEEQEAAASALRAVHARAVANTVGWIIEESAFWLYLLDQPIAANDLAQPYEDHCAGRWREAAAGWQARNRPYEEAIARSDGDEEAQREALAIFDRLGAAPAAARLRRQMRSGGVRTIPRGPIAGTRANPAGLTRRQTQVLGLLAEELTNAEIADRLCISAKTAEHHVAAIMARLEAATRREAATTARKRGLLAVEK
jgi:DNA-binding CsgD family transcriptional regulator/tetratricopeptide (TPR) repeat protein